MVHNRPHMIKGAATGDIACDSYNKYADDVKILKDLGVDFYRFSISWCRLMPDGLSNKINQKGIIIYLYLYILMQFLMLHITTFWPLLMVFLKRSKYSTTKISLRVKDHLLHLRKTIRSSRNIAILKIV